MSILEEIARGEPYDLATRAGDEVVNPDFSSKKRKNDIVNDTVKPDGVTINVDNGLSEQNDVALNVASNVALNRKLVALVKANPGINRMQLAEKLSVTTRTIDRVLVSVGDVVVRRGSKKTGGYYCK